MSIQSRIARFATVEALFPAAIGLSAFLLLTLELLSGQLVLPVFGGTPGVWATTLCFFTAILFTGYLYAHVLVTRLGPIRAGKVHMVVAFIAVIALVIAPRDVVSVRWANIPEALNVLVALLVIAGPPAFLLASTTPLLSAWYGLHLPNPWWLYATSNGASLTALIAYPFLIAPFIGLAAQRWLILGGMLLFVAILSMIVVAIRRGQEAVDAETAAIEAASTEVDEGTQAPAPADRPKAPPLARRRQLIWVCAAFVPAGLLAATTNFVSADLISAPLIWVGPLAVYLLSFVIAFSSRGKRLVRIAQVLAPAAAVLLWIPWAAEAIWPIGEVLVVELGSFLVLAVAIHGRLAADRPGMARLTRFYLMMSAGGMLATAFVALLAPSIFSAVYEYPILIVGALVVLAILPDERARPVSARPLALGRDLVARLGPYIVAASLLILVLSGGHLDSVRPLVGLAIVGGGAVAIAIWPSVLPLSMSVAIVLVALGSSSSAVYQTRTFFGVLRVDADGLLHSEYSGTTLHGAQYQDARSSEPTTYYVASGPLGQVFDRVRATVARPAIGVVGLGVGTMESYARDVDRFTFFEIDKAVVDIANDPRLFSYLSNAPLSPRVILGDGRLSLAAQPARSYDLLILDASSSDSVPVHLLTQEALATYARTVRPGGVMLFNVTNRYYDLSSAVVATARASGLSALATTYVPPPKVVSRLDGTASAWVVVGTDAAVQPFADLGWTDAPGGPVLTDDFSDLLRTLRR